jgi:signal transduction histidine kinase
MGDADLSSREERALATLGRLTRGALHEIANPLLALVGTAELVLGDAEPGTKLHDRLALVQETGWEITEIVRALQGFAREQGAPPAAVALGDSAESAVKLVRGVSVVRDVELALAVRRESSATVAIASPGEVACALVELLLDGLAGAARGDTVELVVSRDGADAVATVAGAGELRLPADTVS